MTSTVTRTRSLAQRLWIYQSERFPLLQHGALVAVLSVAAVCYAALVTDTSVQPLRLAGAFVIALLSFWLLRVSDEIKDAEVDAMYRPERPVPRGLVSLDELKRTARWALAIQAVVAASIDPRLLLPLLLVWGYGALMFVEFGAKDWLRQHPVAYLLSHAAIVPLIDALLVSVHVLPALDGRMPKPAGLLWLLAASFFGSLTLEIGRKMTAPAGERPGVDTYTKMWGRSRALGTWIAAVAGVGLCAAGTIHHVGGSLWLLAPIAGVALMAGVVAVRFRRQPTEKRAALTEPVSAAVLFTNYALIGSLLFLAG